MFLVFGFSILFLAKDHLLASRAESQIDSRSNADCSSNIPWVKDYFREFHVMGIQILSLNT